MVGTAFYKCACLSRMLLDITLSWNAPNDSQYGENIKIHTFVLVSNTALSKYYEKLKESKKDPQKTDENK